MDKIINKLKATLIIEMIIQFFIFLYLTISYPEFFFLFMIVFYGSHLFMAIVAYGTAKDHGDKTMIIVLYILSFCFISVALIYNKSQIISNDSNKTNNTNNKNATNNTNNNTSNNQNNDSVSSKIKREYNSFMKNDAPNINEAVSNLMSSISNAFTGSKNNKGTKQDFTDKDVSKEKTETTNDDIVVEPIIVEEPKEEPKNQTVNEQVKEEPITDSYKEKTNESSDDYWECPNCHNKNRNFINKCSCGIGVKDKKLDECIQDCWKCPKCGKYNRNLFSICSCGYFKEN